MRKPRHLREEDTTKKDVLKIILRYVSIVGAINEILELIERIRKMLK